MESFLNFVYGRNPQTNKLQILYFVAPFSLTLILFSSLYSIVISSISGIIFFALFQMYQKFQDKKSKEDNENRLKVKKWNSILKIGFKQNEVTKINH
jgi:uncharacterized membrane protein YraQ (UPF0718 family)